MKLFSILLVAVSAFAVSCERHDFEGPNGTKQLQPDHAAGGHEATAGAAAVHGEEKKPHGEATEH